MNKQEKIPPRYGNALGWLVTILTPLVLVLTCARLLLTPLFLQIEYNLPGFPEDRYGFTKEDRLYWSGIALDYLLNDAGIGFLQELEFADGSSLYNARELKHMVDVKVVVKSTLLVWAVTGMALVILGLWAWRGRWSVDYLLGLRRGGWLTIILVGSLLLFSLLAFGMFFVFFHNVFFAEGTWLFYYSDSLIRLFPERFWRDVFISAGILTILASLGTIYLTGRTLKKMKG